MQKPLALIVEDDSSLNRIFSLALERDFEVQSCHNGDDAIVKLETILPALAILDLNLPGKSGAEIMRHIRANERFAKTRIILATADERQAEALEHEVDLVLLKPISPMQLRELASRFKNLASAGE